MRLIDLTCPYCSGAIELDQEKEFGFCRYCGHKIYIARDESDKSKDGIKNLEKLLVSAVESNDESSILKYCERILELDSDNSDAWYWKGKVALDNREVESGLVAWRNSIENMEIKELLDISDHMCDLIAESYLYYDPDGNFDSNIPESILRLDNAFDIRVAPVVGNNDDADSFFQRVINDIIAKIPESDDPFIASNGSIKVVLLLLSSVSNYVSICYVAYLFSSAHDALEDVYKRCRSRRDDLYDSYDLRDSNSCLATIRTNISFLEFVYSRIASYIEPYSEESLDILTDYWMEDETDGMSPFSTVMYYGYNAHRDIDNVGLLKVSKIRKIRDDSVSAYLDNYFAPLYSNKLKKQK